MRQGLGSCARQAGEEQDQAAADGHEDRIGRPRLGAEDQGGAEKQGAGKRGRAALNRTGTPEQIERAAVGEARNDAQGPPGDGRPGQRKSGEAQENRVQDEDQGQGQGHGELRPSAQLDRRPGEGGEGKVGEPLRRDRPGRMVPAGDRGQAPGVHQEKVRRQGRQVQDVRVDHPADHHRRHPQRADGCQADQMQRIDPRQPRPEERSIAEAAFLGGGQIDVAEDEAGEDEEHLDPQIALGDEHRGEADVEPRPEGEQHHPGRGEEAEGGQGLQMLGLHGGSAVSN